MPDGIKELNDIERIDPTMYAQEIATEIFNKYHREYGHATVLEIKCINNLKKQKNGTEKTYEFYRNK